MYLDIMLFKKIKFKLKILKSNSKKFNKKNKINFKLYKNQNKKLNKWKLS